MSTVRFQEIIIGTAQKSKELGQLEKKGAIKKIAPRLYTSNLEEEAAIIIRRNWFRLLSELYPGTMLSHRSALEKLPTKNGHIYLTHSYTDIIELPGLIIHFLKGPGPLELDETFFGTLKVSCYARACMENLQQSRSEGEASKTLSRKELEERMEMLIRIRGDKALNEVRDLAKSIAPELKMEKELKTLNGLITDMLGTGLSKNLVSDATKSRVWGEPVDTDRLQLFESLYESLNKREYPDYKDKNTTLKSYQNFAFFEGYFSNYIEGTEFTVEEAKNIITTATPLPARDEDSHDVLGTYQVVSNRTEMATQPTDADDLLKLMKERHAILLNARKAKKPGQFKDMNNRAGMKEFVDWTLVTGTLKRGFEWYSILKHPFAKAAYLMFMISEVHPFLDGNGRIARIMMNAELGAKGMSKIIIPTVYREDYMGTLKKLTKQREGDAYIRMLLKAWEFSSNVYDDDLDVMENYLTACDAFQVPKHGVLKIIPRQFEPIK